MQIKYAGTYVSRWQCGCICTVAAGWLIDQERDERKEFYKEAFRHRLTVQVMTESDPWPPVWECGKPANQCHRPQVDATNEDATHA